LLRLDKVKPTILFADGSRNGRRYRSKPLKLDAVLRCQRTGQTKRITIRGQAVRDWLQSPFVRKCDESCPFKTESSDGLCLHRRALVGRNMLTENCIALVLDGITKKTAFERGD
jgi:hypothetical protein